MDADRALRAQVEVDLHGLGRVDVLVAMNQRGS